MLSEWFDSTMRQDEHNDRDDPYARIRAENMAFSKRKAKFWGTLLFFSVVAVVMLAKGMSARTLWPYLSQYLGQILVISAAYLFAESLFYAARLVFEWLNARQRR